MNCGERVLTCVNDNVNIGIKQIGIPKHNFDPSKNKKLHAIETEIKKHETKNINVGTHNTKVSSLINSAHAINPAVLQFQQRV